MNFFLIIFFISFQAQAMISPAFDGHIVKFKHHPHPFKIGNLISLYHTNDLRSDDIEYIEPNYKFKIPSAIVARDSLIDEGQNNWHLLKVGITNENDKSTISSRPLLVAIIDSGVDLTHPELQNIFYSWRDENNNVIHGYNFINQSSNVDDDNGHGTHVTGIIAGKTGILSNVKILPLKFIDKNGVGDTFNAISAINFAIKMKVDLINASFGSPYPSKALADALKMANEAGILVVTASGNYSRDLDVTPIYPSSYLLENVISVAATDENDDIDPLSDFGKNSVHVAAPGMNIYSTYLNHGHEKLSGTSMAAPVVTGIVGLLKEARPDNSLLEFKAALINGCDEVEKLSLKVRCHGRVNYKKSLQYLLSLGKQ